MPILIAFDGDGAAADDDFDVDDELLVPPQAVANSPHSAANVPIAASRKRGFRFGCLSTSSPPQ
jgi:hypothetical protein